ncbi:MAG TPA: Gfo/Idh/MocA family oxidoreductase [Dehalococcoidia bacterium]|nr:Gfo/Idh/MocA family oxidoreductase [Dehalococcoidia bacterium]
MTKLRVAFIGAGRIADLHALGYRDNPDAELYAVCDADAEVAARRAAEWGAAKHCSNDRQLLADPDVDAVEILTPHHLHAEMAVAALAAGKHVSLQKPMARTLAEADEIAAAARASDRVFRVFENYRYYPPYVRAKELLEAGEIGEPVSLRVKVIDGDPRYGWRVPARSWAWRLDEAKSGGGIAVFDHGYHIFSIAIFFLGAVEETFAWIERTEVAAGVKVDAPALIVWRHAGGKPGQASRFGTWETVLTPEMVVRSKYYANDEWLEITGRRGVIWVTRCTGEMLAAPPLIVYRDGETRSFHDIESDWGASFVEGTRAFVGAIREGGEPPLTAAEGREVLLFALAAQRSAAEGRPVRLSELG